jgi:hypothetical protein
MRSLLLSAVLALLTLAPAARADVCVRTPWVTVQVGRGGVFVQAPGVTVSLPRAVPVVAPPAAKPGPVMLPPPMPVPAEPAPGPAVVVPTPAQFAAGFTPQPGRYEVVLQHPATGRPVKVNFTLPPGTPRAVRVYPYRLAFDYDRHNVVLVFQRNGGVRVRD